MIKKISRAKSGVGIQELAVKDVETDKRIAELERENGELQFQIEQLKADIKKIKNSLK